MAEVEALVDPAVSRAKFDRELAQYRALEDDHLRRGWWLLKAEFPEVFVVFAAPQLKPPAVVFGVLLDFTNYDLWPPSVLLVDPFTRVPYKASELPSVLRRRIGPPLRLLAGPGMLEGGPAMVVPQETRLMMWHNVNDVPFLCLPGVREYHDHPGHSGDPWLLHRLGGEGRLHFLLEKLYQYGVKPITDYNVQLVPQVSGFAQPEAPE
ncbi:MAG: hypothetical protein M3Q71_08255 [Chloroflexota bacterium]|nr:hypothetical protein [Chloroflexota bacterium]